MSAATLPARTGLTALTLATGLLLAGCGGDADASAGATGHDHGSAEAPATLEGGVREGGIQLVDPYQKPDFTLTDTSGAPFDFAERTADGPTLLFFGFTHCPDICPTTMADVMLALGEVDPAVAEQTSVVFVTTDPARDTPEVLREYLDRFDAGPPADFIGLTGDQEQIDQAQLAAGIPVAQNGGESHSALLLLYGTDGEADVAFDSANTARDIALELAAAAG